MLANSYSRHDVSGWGKAAWTVFIIVLPFIGVLTYLVFQHDGMTERNTQRAQAAQGQFDQYVREVADKSGPAGEISAAKQLLDSGTITRDEFESLKAKAL